MIIKVQNEMFANRFYWSLELFLGLVFEVDKLGSVFFLLGLSGSGGGLDFVLELFELGRAELGEDVGEAVAEVFGFGVAADDEGLILETAEYFGVLELDDLVVVGEQVDLGDLGQRLGAELLDQVLGLLVVLAAGLVHDLVLALHGALATESGGVATELLGEFLSGFENFVLFVHQLFIVYGH